MRKILRLFVYGMLMVIVIFLMGWVLYTPLQLMGAEYKWKQKGILDYEIVVSFSNPWEEQEYTIVVQGGKVIKSDAICKPAALQDVEEECVVQLFNPKDYTVEGLFNQARQATSAEIVFDDTYYYPKSVFSNLWGAHDAWWGLYVISFRVITP